MWIGYDGLGTSAVSPGPTQREHQVREAFLGPDGRADLGLEVERRRRTCARYRSVTASRSFGMPLLVEYRWLRGLRTASTSFSTATSGDGMSGLPNARSMTSSPARRNSHLQRVDLRERVRRQSVDPAELHDGARYQPALCDLRQIGMYLAQRDGTHPGGAARPGRRLLPPRPRPYAGRAGACSGSRPIPTTSIARTTSASPASTRTSRRSRTTRPTDFVSGMRTTARTRRSSA